MDTQDPVATKGKPVGAVVQAVRLLRVLGEADKPIGVSAAARTAEINTSTAFNVLRTLVTEGLVAFDEEAKTYALGFGLLDLCGNLREPSLAERLRSEIVALAQETGRLIALWKFTEKRVVLLDRAQNGGPVRLDIDVTQRMPRYLGAIGRAAAAAEGLGEAALRREFKQLRWAGSISPQRYIDEVGLARESGYGVDHSALYEGIVAIGAIVTDEQGQPAFGLSAIEFSERIDRTTIERVGEALASAARKCSLG